MQDVTAGLERSRAIEAQLSDPEFLDLVDDVERAFRDGPVHDREFAKPQLGSDDDQQFVGMLRPLVFDE